MVGRPRTGPLLRLLSGAEELRVARDDEEFIGFMARWHLTPRAAHLALCLGEKVLSCMGIRLYIISGGRTCEKQRQLRMDGRPTAGAAWAAGPDPFETCRLSTHVIDFPQRQATGFDLGADRKLTAEEWERVAELAATLQLRWGGERDPNHFDRGPRSQTG